MNDSIITKADEIFNQLKDDLQIRWTNRILVRSHDAELVEGRKLKIGETTKAVVLLIGDRMAETSQLKIGQSIIVKNINNNNIGLKDKEKYYWYYLPDDNEIIKE